MHPKLKRAYLKFHSLLTAKTCRFMVMQVEARLGGNEDRWSGTRQPRGCVRGPLRVRNNEAENSPYQMYFSPCVTLPVRRAGEALLAATNRPCP